MIYNGLVDVVRIQGLTNRVSGRPGQPKEGAGQPELGARLPSGQPSIFLKHFLNIYDPFKAIDLLIYLSVYWYFTKCSSIYNKSWATTFNTGQLRMALWLPSGQLHLKTICHALQILLFAMVTSR